MVDLLLQSRARRCVYDFSGRTPQQLAREMNTVLGSHDEVLRVFSDYNAKRAASKRRRKAEKISGAAAALGAQLARPGIAMSTLAEPFLPQARQTADALVQCSLDADASAGTDLSLEAALESERAARRAAEAEVLALKAKLEEALCKEVTAAE